jgi:hypothetical protein
MPVQSFMQTVGNAYVQNRFVFVGEDVDIVIMGSFVLYMAFFFL